ncbi:MAG: hypothetical protein IT441_06675 [Phycisphaeraceae bacterium]|nr:hypothetical protein [Phycisphaeraceae bacterium]
MTRRSLSVLAAINVVLLAALVLTVLWPERPVMAQSISRGGDFAMLTGEPSSGSGQNVFLIDLRSGDVAVLTFSSANNSFNFIDQRNLPEDIQLRPAR